MNNSIFIEKCVDMLKQKEIKNQIKKIMKPIILYIFEEMSLYLYFFIFIFISSFIIHLGVLTLLIKFYLKSVNFNNNNNNNNN